MMHAHPHTPPPGRSRHQPQWRFSMLTRRDAVRLLPLGVLLGLTLSACNDVPTAPALDGPVFSAVHGQGVPPAAFFYLRSPQGDLSVTWTWQDDKPWDLVSFELTLDGRKVEGNWSIKPYAEEIPGVYPGSVFRWQKE